MPSGKLSCLVSGNARLLEDVSLPATVVIDVLGSAYHASSHINGRATSQDGETQEPQWRQELSMSLRPDDVGEGRARVSLRNSSHALVGEGVVSLDTVLAEDVDRTEVELHDHDGHSVGNLGLVLRLFHGRSDGSFLARNSQDPAWVNMHRQMSRDIALKAS